MKKLNIQTLIVSSFVLTGKIKGGQEQALEDGSFTGPCCTVKGVCPFVTEFED